MDNNTTQFISDLLSQTKIGKIKWGILYNDKVKGKIYEENAGIRNYFTAKIQEFVTLVIIETFVQKPEYLLLIYFSEDLIFSAASYNIERPTLLKALFDAARQQAIPNIQSILGAIVPPKQGDQEEEILPQKE